MRLTCVLCKQSHKWHMKNLWRERGVMKVPPTIVPIVLQNTGVTINDPAPKYLHKPVVDYPDLPIAQMGLDKPTNSADHPDYHDEPLLAYGYRTLLLQPMKQALNLSKTVIASENELPKQCLEHDISVPNQDMLMQRYIMQANVWDSTKKKLPKRFDPRIPGWHFKREFGIPEGKTVHTILRNLLRLSEMAAESAPGGLSKQRRLSTEPYVSMHYNMQGTPIQISGPQEYLTTSDLPLPPFATEDKVDATTLQPLPPLYPLSPLIDLESHHHYAMDNITPWSEGFSHPHPHTLYISNFSFVSKEQQDARALLFMFAHCLAHAKATRGWDVKTLPEPISMQCIITNKANFDLYAFQLNTLDFMSMDGVKNLFWMDSENALYQKILPKRAMLRNTKYEDYDGQVLKKLLSMYAAGWRK